MSISYKEALQNFEKAKLELEKARLAEVSSVIDDIKQKLAEYHITAEDLGFKSATRIKGSRLAKKGGQKYANPKNPEITWSGAGKRPKWVAEHLTSGGQLEDLRIKTEDAATPG